MGVIKHKPKGASPSIKSGRSLLNMGTPFQMAGSSYTPLEGNKFIGEKVKAQKMGANTFEVDGDTFPVTGKSSSPASNYGKIVPKMYGNIESSPGKMLGKKHK